MTAGSPGVGTEVGWFCAYTPLEVIEATGFIPVRVRGAFPRDGADAVLGVNICPYTRSCLQQGMDGGAPAATVFCGCCDSLRRLKDAWERFCDTSFTAMIDVPRRNDRHGLSILTSSFEKLASRLGSTGRGIDADSLRRAILRRAAVQEDLRSRAGEGLRGSDLLALHEMQQKGSGPFCCIAKEDERIPVAVTGNMLNGGALLDLIEECGGRVVALDLCNAERASTWEAGPPEELPEDLDGLFEALAAAYLRRRPCPRMLEREERAEAMRAIVSSLGVEGVVFTPLMHCDAFGFEIVRNAADRERLGVPSIVIKGDYEPEVSGQERTRIEAFMEML